MTSKKIADTLGVPLIPLRKRIVPLTIGSKKIVPLTAGDDFKDWISKEGMKPKSVCECGKIIKQCERESPCGNPDCPFGYLTN
jgi:hypothetical protein